MALKTIKKINKTFKLLYRKYCFLIPELRRLLCKAIMQPHFGYTYSAWYPNLTQKLKKNFKLCKTNAFAFVFSWIKCLQFLIKNLKI